MQRRILVAVVCLFVASPSWAAAAETAEIPLHVLYLARRQEPDRTAAFHELLAKHFARATVVDRVEFRSDMLRSVDVVVLDWSQQEREGRNYPSPLGPFDEWQKPLVLLGSAGLLLAGPWNVIGGAG